MEQVLAAPLSQTAIPLKRISYRIESIDLLRGLVMIVMALDHVRDFIHVTGFSDDPLNMATTTPALFLTRWITHYCAPVFVFLAGTSGWFQHMRKSTKQLSSFLITRGLWLALVEIIIVNFSFSFDPVYSIIGLQTIWAIGISMIILGLVIWLPFQLIFGLGLVIVFGHNLLDFYEARQAAPYSLGYSLLHHQGFFPLWGQHHLLVMYPFLSWSGLMMLGYCFGKLFTSYNGFQRKKILTFLGVGVILFFMALRTLNIYGNPEPWMVQKNQLFTFFSFIDTHKYPPSLLYMCMTIGPAILFIAWGGHIKNGLTRFITVFGRVPFFYYIIHFFVIHLISALLFFSRGHSFAEGMSGAAKGFANFIIPGEGYSLWVVYAVWIFVVISLYPVCKWFSQYKLTHRQWWLSYF